MEIPRLWFFGFVVFFFWQIVPLNVTFKRNGPAACGGQKLHIVSQGHFVPSLTQKLLLLAFHVSLFSPHKSHVLPEKGAHSGGRWGLL